MHPYFILNNLLIIQSLNTVLEVIHTAHQRETKCILLANILAIENQEYQRYSKICIICKSAHSKLKLQQPDHPEHPRESIGTDIFEQNGYKYRLVIAYHTRSKQLQNTSADTVYKKFTQITTEYG